MIAAILACGVSFVVAGCGSTKHPSSVKRPSAKQLLASILAAANARHSVHVVSTAEYGTVHLTDVDDIGRTQGIQRVTLAQSGNTGEVTVIATRSAAYIRGDAFTLANYIGATAAAAKKYAHRWIKFTPKDKGYKNTIAGVTLASEIGQLAPAPPLRTVRHVTIGGVPAFGVRGVTPSSQPPPAEDTIYARADGAPLPIKQVVELGTQRLTVTLSRWDEPLRLQIPRDTVPASVALAGP